MFTDIEFIKIPEHQNEEHENIKNFGGYMNRFKYFKFKGEKRT